MSASAIEAHGLSKRFILRHNRAASLKVHVLGLLHKNQREVLEEFWALRDVSLTIARGESIGLVGRNGSGKSTLLKLIAGIHRPTSGRLLVAGGARIGTMIELGVGFHPDLSGTENVFLNASIHGLSREATEAIYPKIVEYSGLGRFMDIALKNYSTGMHMRLGFAIAANMDPDILLLDEVFAVGDEDFQQQCIRTMRQFGDDGRTIVFVSHTVIAIRAMCRRVCLLDHGRMLFAGGVEEGLAEYHRLLAEPAPRPSPAAAPTGEPASQVSRAATPASVLRDDAGEWRLDLLRHEGLAPHHRVLEVVLDTPGPSTPLARHAEADRYRHWRIGLATTPAGGSFDYAVAAPLFSGLRLNAIVQTVAAVMRCLRPGGRFYASWFDTPDPASFEPVLRPTGVTTYADQEPYQYSFDMLNGIFTALGAQAHRVSGVTPPNGESVLVIVKDSGATR